MHLVNLEEVEQLYQPSPKKEHIAVPCRPIPVISNPVRDR
mgnify:FL=1